MMEELTPQMIAHGWAIIEQSIDEDPDIAWGWLCNIAVPIMDAIDVSHEQANVAAAAVLQCLFRHDITTHPLFEYEKSGAQTYVEMRLAAEADEDAAIAKAKGTPS